LLIAISASSENDALSFVLGIAGFFGLGAFIILLLWLILDLTSRVSKIGSKIIVLLFLGVIDWVLIEVASSSKNNTLSSVFGIAGFFGVIFFIQWLRGLINGDD